MEAFSRKYFNRWVPIWIICVGIGYYIGYVYKSLADFKPLMLYTH